MAIDDNTSYELTGAQVKDLANKIKAKADSSSLATVATTGDYTDLTNKPTIPATQVNSDWDAVSGVSQILNKPSLATVATSGNYNDLTNQPTIPTVNDATLTIQQNGTTVGTFTANASSNTTINLTGGGASYTAGNGISIDANNEISIDTTVVAEVSDIPTKTSDLSNDGSDGTSTYVEADELATVAISGSYNDLSNRPTIPNGQKLFYFDINPFSAAAPINGINVEDENHFATTWEDVYDAYIDGGVIFSDGLSAESFYAPTRMRKVYDSQEDTTSLQVSIIRTLSTGKNGNALIQCFDWTTGYAENVYIGMAAKDEAFTGTDGMVAGTAGLVPAPATTDAGKFLKADGTWSTYDDPMIDEAACAIKPMSNAFAQTLANDYNDAHADPQDPSSYISSLNVKTAIPFMFVNQSGEPISTLGTVRNALKSSNRVVYNGTDDKFVSSHSSASGYAKFGLFDPLYSEVKNYKVRAGNSSDSPAFKQYLPYIIVLDEYGSQNAWGYTDGTESEDSLTDAPETKYQIAHDANGNLYMASDVNSAGDWKQISNTSYVPNVTYYLQSGTTAGISGITTYIYTDSNRTTPADPAILVDNFNAGKAILLEYEQTGAAEPYGITFQVNSASADGDPATQCQYKLLISELNNDNGNYNAVVTQLSTTVTAGTTFNGSWGIVRVVVPTVYNGTLTITQNGTTVGTFTANQSTNTTVNLAGGVYADDPTSSANPDGWITPNDIDWSTFTYSTSEQRVGTWVNGKPVYKKTVNTGTMPNNTRKQVAHGISNLGFIISMSGSAYGNSTYLPIPYADTASANSLGLYASNTDLILFTSANLSYLTTSYVTIYYTKTTD